MSVHTGCRVVDAQPNHHIDVAVPIDIPDGDLCGSGLRARRSESHRVCDHGRRIKRIVRQDGDMHAPLARGIDSVRRSGRPDVDANSRLRGLSTGEKHSRARRHVVPVNRIRPSVLSFGSMTDAVVNVSPPGARLPPSAMTSRFPSVKRKAPLPDAGTLLEKATLPPASSVMGEAGAAALSTRCEDDVSRVVEPNGIEPKVNASGRQHRVIETREFCHRTVYVEKNPSAIYERQIAVRIESRRPQWSAGKGGGRRGRIATLRNRSDRPLGKQQEGRSGRQKRRHKCHLPASVDRRGADDGDQASTRRYVTRAATTMSPSGEVSSRPPSPLNRSCPASFSIGADALTGVAGAATGSPRRATAVASDGALIHIGLGSDGQL
jgi:hypothetical protein